MSNIVSIVKWLFNSFSVIVVLLLIAWLFRSSPSIKNSLLIFVGLIIFLFYISPLTNLLAESWERKYKAFSISDHTEIKGKDKIHIVVLGSGYSNDPSISITSQLSTETALRLLEAVRIYNEVENAAMVTSGATLWQKKSQAQAVAEAAVSLGVLIKDTLYLNHTRFTQDEASDYVERFGKDHTVILVTEAMHMQRAVYWFNHFGVNVIPAPCNYFYKKDLRRKIYSWLPSYRKIDTFDRIIKELGGLGWAKFSTKYLS